jgi:membrane protease YdiL (CAAX protease family)
LVAAALLIPSPTARAGAILALVLLAAFTAVVGRALARGEQPDCNCFGAVRSEPISRWTLVRNLLLGAVAAALIATGPGTSLAALDGGTAVAIAGAAAGLLLLGLTWFTWELFKQNGRLLARVRALEETAGAPPSFTLPGPPDKIGGLAIGDLVPDLALATVDGGSLSVREVATAAPVPAPSSSPAPAAPAAIN